MTNTDLRDKVTAEMDKAAKIRNDKEKADQEIAKIMDEYEKAQEELNDTSVALNKAKAHNRTLLKHDEVCIYSLSGSFRFILFKWRYCYVA